jgi:catechol-2,3-dioxygenase
MDARLNVRDLNRAWRFYQDFFGFRELAHATGDGIRIRNAFGVMLALTQKPKSDPSNSASANIELSSADEVRALYGRMCGADEHICSALALDAESISFACLDPDGNVVRVAARRPGPRQKAAVERAGKRAPGTLRVLGALAALAIVGALAALGKRRLENG